MTVWQKSHCLALMVYAKTANFPSRELFGLTSQMRRAAVSVGANIAEGTCRRGDREFARFLQVALASAGELEYHLLLASDLGLLKKADSEPLAEAASKSSECSRG